MARKGQLSNKILLAGYLEVTASEIFMETQIIFYGKLKLKADYQTLCKTHVAAIRHDKIIISPACHYHIGMTEHFTYSDGHPTNARDNIYCIISLWHHSRMRVSKTAVSLIHVIRTELPFTALFFIIIPFLAAGSSCVLIFLPRIFFIRRSGDN